MPSYETFTHLAPYADQLECEKESVIGCWINIPEVNERLKANEIAPKFFGKHFAVRILEYAIGVLRGENQLGQCPIMSVLIRFFSHANIPIRDVVIICTGLRNAMIEFCYKIKPMGYALYREVAYLMDQNLAGVLDEMVYVRYHAKTESTQHAISASTPTVTEVLKERVSAEAYLAEIDYNHDDLDELGELKEDVIDALYQHDGVINSTLQEKLAMVFDKYGSVLGNFYEFNALSEAIIMFASMLHSVDLEALDSSRHKRLFIYFEGIIKDLDAWKDNIFITQSAEDIHYLDESLYSSIAQLEAELTPNASDDEDDTLELF